MGACQSHPRDHTWRWLRSAVFQGNTGFFTEQSVELAPVWHPILARFPPARNYAAILAQVSTPASIVPPSEFDMSKLKPALVFVVALTLFVWFWLQLMSLYGATYSAALSLLKPVRFWVI